MIGNETARIDDGDNPPIRLNPRLDPELITRVYHAAGRGFSHRYSKFRLFENYQQGLHQDRWLMRVLEYLNTPIIRGLMRLHSMR